MTVLASRSRSRIRLQYLEKSITSAAPTVCPASDEPPPRGKIGTPWLAASSTAPIGVVGRFRDDHADRLDLVVRGVGRVEHARGAVETDFAADARVQLGLEHPGSLDRRPAGLRFGVDPPDPSGGSGSLVSTLAGSGTTGMERRLPLRSAAKRSVDSLAGSLGEQTSKGG